jgi:hypothetical protein
MEPSGEQLRTAGMSRAPDHPPGRATEYPSDGSFP